MEQHPVPQNISSYQFHLVGDMTLKQFLELAGGVLIGVLFYATGLPGIIKWPLILISAGIGAALAFVPFEERPLEQWIFAFFRSIYSPTLFHWEKKEGVKYFADEIQQTTVETKPASSTFANIPFLSKLEATENSYLSKLTGLFSQNSSPSQHQPVQTQTVITIPTRSSFPSTTVNSAIPVLNEPIKKEVNIPQTNFVSVDKSVRPQIVVEEETEKVNLQTTSVTPTLNSQNVPQTTQAIFSVDAALPSIPTIPNTVSGQVMDSTKKIIDGAILEIVDEANRPVRALKTNKAGHFLIVTPLTNGKYKIIVDKEGYNFEPIEFEARGTIIQPIAIKAN